MANKLLSDLAKGAWSGLTAYTVGDIVDSSGSSYACIANTTNNEPPNATYWALLASKGDTGATGATGATGDTGATGATGADGEVTADGVFTLTNKTVALGSNTISGTLAEFNTAVTDANLASIAGAETLTNKTLTSPVINTPTGIVKGDVGLGNVDNTSDASKPVSTATQTALDLKANLASPALTGTPSITNTTDQASNQALILQSDRATPATNDNVYVSFLLSDSAGNQDQFGRISVVGGDVTSTSEDGFFQFGLMQAGSLANRLRITTGGIEPETTDTVSLGNTAKMFSDLFLASGGVINWNNGNATLTHSAGLLTSNVPLSLGTSNALTAGTIELGHATDTTLSRSAAGVLAVEGVNVLTVAGGTMSGNITLGENTSIALDPALSADGKYSGITITGTAGATLAFGDLIYLSSVDSRWELADADAATTADRLLGMCVLAAASDGDPTTILLQGNIRADAAFPALTIGSPVYVGETAGDVQTAIPTGADNVIRRVGYALTADELYFAPSMDSQTTVA